MDKYEYKVREEEIKNLVALGEYVQAAEIADTIDWRRVKSVMMLCTVSDIYKINRRYEDARDMLLLAYERRPGGRNICYALCELYLKTEEIVQAVEYYKEFVQVAPRDPGRFILLYKIYEAQEVSLEERIEVLEELKKRDYREKWAYELAYLYHRVGLETRCVEECDEMILWFGEGQYVIKAMELKMLHQPLSEEQQEKYDHRFDDKTQAQSEEETELSLMERPFYEEDAGQDGGYDDSVPDGDTKVFEFVSVRKSLGKEIETTVPEEFVEEVFFQEDEEEPVPEEPVQDAEIPEHAGMQSEQDELDIQVKMMDVGQYNTINLQAELAEGLREILDTEQKDVAKEDQITHSIIAPMLENDDENGWENIEESPEEVAEENPEKATEEMQATESEAGEPEEPAEAGEIMESEEVEESGEPENVQGTEESGTVEKRIPVVAVEPPKEIAHVLSQESDGQISLVLPESSAVEKQITGQMSIEDILAEWERVKKKNEEKRKEDVRQRVLQQTGNMFTEFEAAVRDGLLEQLEKTVDDFENTELPQEMTEENEEIVIPDGTAEFEELGETAETDTIAELAELEEATDADAIAEFEGLGVVADADGAAETDDLEELAEADTVAEFEGLGEIEEIEENAGTEVAVETGAAAEADAEPGIAEIPEVTGVYEAVDAGENIEQTADGGTEGFYETAELQETEVTQGAEAGETEEAGEAESEESEDSEETEENPRENTRPMTSEELEMYAPYIQSKKTKDQIVRAVDNVSLAAYTGNVIITGEEGMDTLTLAKNMIHEAKTSDGNFSGKTAKISGLALNKKSVEETVNLLQNGALIIQRAGGMNEETAQSLYKILQRENLGIVVFLEDRKKAMNKFLEANEQLLSVFTARIDVEAMSNDELVAFGKQYAYEKEYSIDNFGVLALHTRIEELQTIDHAVTAPEVKLMVDEAIHNANRKTPGHFFDILFAKRYDEEDMIILTERDFA